MHPLHHILIDHQHLIPPVVPLLAAAVRNLARRLQVVGDLARLHGARAPVVVREDGGADVDGRLVEVVERGPPRALELVTLEARLASSLASVVGRRERGEGKSTHLSVEADAESRRWRVVVVVVVLMDEVLEEIHCFVGFTGWWASESSWVGARLFI